MRVRIDHSGRLVLPKPLRDRLGLQAGEDLEAEETPGGVELRPVRQRPSLASRDGLLVHCGKLPKGLDWSRLMEDEREDRMRGLVGKR